ncbi:NhaP-type Na+/H+ or K+/H+ antiporter [Streptomyces sp. V4I23]|uniref:cation:proton antiporter domain-containing protein n=1 Tax=Streptomyces sp. V4I23 TaxID=3042282 RepID=UPI00277FD0F9|nr:cation:proton antiporter [Streptomyces sp. V4I23]MDQ1006908.1 NhaP-type Na+/H+ or K+/H+ antiporter [Streptomyces sp. V4I23]
MIALLVLLSLLFLWAVVSDRLARWSITAPITFAMAGILLSGGDHPVVPLDMDTHTFERTIELVLAVMLFTDATEARDYARLRGPVGERRLLGLALPASLVLATLAGALVFPGTSWWLLVVTALVVMPVDLAPLLTFLRDERVPLRVRAALNMEGGFNDGLISPLFVFCVANLASAEGASFADLLLNALKGAVYAAIAGTVLGYLASRVVRRALESGWAKAAGLRLAGLALPFLTYAASVLVGGNGFVAAFVAGLWYANTVFVIGGDSLDLVHDVSHLLALAAWYAFGSVAAEAFADGIALQVLAYAVLVLSVARFVPVVASLTGIGFSRPERAAVGWLGPRGVTSIVFAVLAYVQLPKDDAALVVNVTAATVLLSVILHGVTAEPVARWFARHPQSEEPVSPPAPGP